MYQQSGTAVKSYALWATVSEGWVVTTLSNGAESIAFGTMVS